MGTPHELGTTEREIFSKIAFVDYGYFYDLDGKWYYIDPGPLRIKMPLELVDHHLNQNGDEFDFTYSVVSRVGQTILGRWYEDDPDFHSYLDEHGIDAVIVKQFYDRFGGDEPGWRVMLDLDRSHPSVLQYFDPWVLIRSDADYQEITEIVLSKWEDPHVETIHW